MPRRSRPNIGRSSQRAQDVASHRESLTPHQQSQFRENRRINIAQRREQENEEERNERLSESQSTRRSARQRITNANRAENQLANRTRMQTTRALQLSSFNRIAFQYNPDIDYSTHDKISIGEMDKECQYCHALKFKNETIGMCCSSGKVVLPILNLPPDPLKSLMSGTNEESKLFLSKIRKFNNCFQMTSFAANIVSNTDAQGRNFASTFKIQGQIYHQYGSLLPMLDEPHKFLQIYFMGDLEAQVNLRCQNQRIERINERAIVSTLEPFLAEKNQLIRVFKCVQNQLQNDNYSIVIKPDKVPLGEHNRRFNAPTVDEVGIVMVGEAFERRDVRIMRRSNSIQVIQDTHRSYDALQYPLIFWEGEDGYHINIKQTNPSTGEHKICYILKPNFFKNIIIRINRSRVK